MPGVTPTSPRALALLAVLTMLAACGSAPGAPAGTVLVEGGPLRLPGGEPANLAPFYVDEAPTQGEQTGAPRSSVSWLAASAACRARGMRLPTDAEWQQIEAHPEGLEGLRDIFQWSHSGYEPPPGEPIAPEQRGQRRVVRGGCCPFMPAWNERGHRAAYPQDRASAWIGYRCAQPIGREDPNLALEERWQLSPEAIDEGEAIRQLLAGLFGPDRAPTDDAVRARIEALAPGATGADVGCGLGALSLELARQVGPAGRVYAVDVDEEVLAFARAAASERGLTTVRTVHAEAGDTRLPPACCDGILLYDMAPGLRDEDLPGFSASLSRALAPDGRLWLYHHPGEAQPQAAIDALLEQDLVLLETVRDPSELEDSPASPTKLWVFGRVEASP